MRTDHSPHSASPVTGLRLSALGRRVSVPAPTALLIADLVYGSRRARHAAEAVEVIGLVPLSARKALRFGLAREGGRLRGVVEHVGLSPDGRAVTRAHGQRLVVSEAKALRIVEALAGLGARLREERP